MSSKPPPTDHPFTGAQKQYLEGFFSGAQLRGGLRFGDVEPAPERGPDAGPKVKLCKEEKLKLELHPLDAYPEIRRKAQLALPPEGGDIYRFKSNGLFWLAPVKDGYMCRLRIPGGWLTAAQLRELGSIAGDLASGFLQITTRNNIQIRVIPPGNTTELLRRVVGCGLHSRGAGADNVRNLTASPAAGLDPHELIDVKPLVDDLQSVIMNDREFYDLPRKFNISFNGGGRIGVAEDTNDIGMRAFRDADGSVRFQVLLGGVTGHREWAEHSGAVCTPEQSVEVAAAMTKVFARNGNRGSRGKARLVYLLKDWGLDRFIAETESLLGFELERRPAGAVPVDAGAPPPVPHPHLGAHPQKQAGLCYLGVSTPVGVLQRDEVDAIARVAEEFGSGDLRLTIFESLLITNIPADRAGAAEAALARAGLSCKASNFRGGTVACTGNRYCKYSAADTKGHAVALGEFIDSQLELDLPVNVHVTGCPHSCAQHYIGDIGLLACKVELDGAPAEGFHVFVGGGFGEHKNFGRQLFKAVPAGPALQRRILGLLRAYLAERERGQSFQSFSTGRELGELASLTAAHEPGGDLPFVPASTLRY